MNTAKLYFYLKKIVNKICWHHDVIEILLKVALDTNRSYYFNEVIM
jgi:hypothetical protein